MGGPSNAAALRPHACQRRHPTCPDPLCRRSQQHWVLISKPQEDEAQGLPGAQHQDKATMPYVRGVAFDAAGRYLLAGSEDKAAGLRVWDCSSWELIQTM